MLSHPETASFGRNSMRVSGLDCAFNGAALLVFLPEDKSQFRLDLNAGAWTERGFLISELWGLAQTHPVGTGPCRTQE